MPACISVLDPVNEAEYPFLVNVTHPCAFAILVDDFYDASQFLDTLDSFALLNGIEFFQPVRQREFLPR